MVPLLVERPSVEEESRASLAHEVEDAADLDQPYARSRSRATKRCKLAQVREVIVASGGDTAFVDKVREIHQCGLPW
jgi:hypothetical protein